MPVKYSLPVKNARLQAVIDAIGRGGKLKIGTDGMGQVLATVELDSPAFEEPEDGYMILASTPRKDLAADRTGKAEAAIITDAKGSIIVDGLTVSEGEGGDIELSSVNIRADQEVRITSGIITHS